MTWHQVHQVAGAWRALLGTLLLEDSLPPRVAAEQEAGGAGGKWLNSLALAQRGDAEGVTSRMRPACGHD